MYNVNVCVICSEKDWEDIRKMPEYPTLMKDFKKTKWVHYMSQKLEDTGGSQSLNDWLGGICTIHACYGNQRSVENYNFKLVFLLFFYLQEKTFLLWVI